MERTPICRLCLKLYKGEEYFLILNEDRGLIELIFQFLTIEIISESLESYYLCSECSEVLENFNKFKIRCVENDVAFRNKYQFTQEPDKEISQISIKLPNEPSEVEKIAVLEIAVLKSPLIYENQEPNQQELPNKTKTSKSSYVRDRRKLPCHVCGKLVSNATYTAHVSLHDLNNRQFTCEICNRSYRQKHNLTKHLNTHTKEALFKCSAAHCGKVFDAASTLRKHYKILHTNIRDHVCKICGRGFAIASGLSGHMRTKHCKEKTNACRECGKLFKTPGEVKLHMKTHTKRDPYVCPECNEAFPKASILKDHRTNVHNFPNVVGLVS